MTDARGNTTDYSYDPTHGGALTATLPAPTTGAVRPQTRFGYSPLQAYYKNSSGSIAASGQSTYMLTETSACQTLASCSGSADEVKTTIGDGPTGSANNLLAVTMSSGAGDGSLTATRSLTYDNVGNATYVTARWPAARTRAARSTMLAGKVAGLIGPDPDGAGALVNRAVRMTYNLDGQATKVERGTTAGQSDTNWSAFTPAEVVDVTYSSDGLELTRKLSSGGTTYALTQSGYNANGQLQCTALRMNPAVYGSLPASACQHGTAGSDGPDRITQLSYDAAGRARQLDEGVGTAEQRTERS